LSTSRNRIFQQWPLPAHEQANSFIKADVGAIGITEDPSALKRWMVAGPDISRLVAQYEVASASKEVAEQTMHHKHTHYYQKGFVEKVNKLCQVLQEMGNPVICSR
jgi:hypothetical protein